MPGYDSLPLPLPLSTTWAVLESGGARVRRDDEVLVVSADLPGHRWSHAISVLDPGRVDEAARWLARAREEFPETAFPAIGLPARPDRGLWREQPCPASSLGAAEWWPQHWMALEARKVEPHGALPAGYRVIPVATQSQWAQFAGLPSPGGEAYQRTWTELKRRRQETGVAQFFAGICDGEVVGTGGVVLCDLAGRRVARFEDVQTLPAHRRQGLASHVIAAAHAWAAGQGAAMSVIVADAEDEAIDLYHRIGFTDSDEAWMVLPRLVG